MINLITISRAFLLLPLAWVMLSSTEKSWAAFVIFIIGGMTDFLDGWLARKLDKTSAFGAILDQITDKIFVVGTLVLMIAAGELGKLILIPILLIIAREFFVSGLREYAAQHHRIIPVDRFGKIKTAVQFIAIACLLLPQLARFEEGQDNLAAVSMFTEFGGFIFLWLAAILGIFSAVRYFSAIKSPE